MFGEPSEKKRKKDEAKEYEDNDKKDGSENEKKSDEKGNEKRKVPEKKSQSLTPNLPVMSPKEKRGVASSRSKAKREAELNGEIRKALSTLDNLAKPSPIEEKNPCVVLGESLGAALSAMKDEEKQRAWKRKLRIIISDIEDGLFP